VHKRKIALILTALAGVFVASLLFYLQHRAAQPPSLTEMEVSVAEKFGIGTEEYRRLVKMGGTIRDDGGVVSDEDWEFLQVYWNGDDLKLRSMAITALSQLDKDSPRKEEAIQVARAYLEEGHTEGSVGPIRVLMNFEEDDWRIYATEMARSDDTQKATLGRNLLAMERDQQ
jgi:hypothetical protein